jgi:hypothetical protein
VPAHRSPDCGHRIHLGVASVDPFWCGVGAEVPGNSLDSRPADDFDNALAGEPNVEAPFDRFHCRGQYRWFRIRSATFNKQLPPV